ncbi:MAG: 30S ribosomal protein S4 [Candidatus Bathyarchaeia archaeon]
MGDPKKQKKKYETQRFPWRTDILQEELKLLGQYGLRNKKELWRHETTLSKFRGIARALIGKSPEERRKMEEELLTRLKKLGMIHETAVLDDVLDLTIEDVLERRLQTVIFRKGMARSIYQARQLITHGHIVIGGKRVTVPSYLVTRQEEEKIAFAPESPLANPSHPTRQVIAAVAPSAGKKPQKGGENK